MSDRPRPHTLPDLSAYLPKAVLVIVDCLAGELPQAPGTEHPADVEMAIAIADALYCEGVSALPSAKVCNHSIARYQRDNAICNQFDGHNYAEMAARHTVSERTVRRIIHTYFQSGDNP